MPDSETLLPEKLKSIAEIVTTPIGGEVDFQGWNGNSTIFNDLIGKTRPRVIIEVGSWKGQSARTMADKSTQYGSKIVCVDTWLGGIDHLLSELPQDRMGKDEFGQPDIFRTFLRNFQGTEHASRIYPLRQSSVNGARFLAAGGVRADLIYIDASHEYEDVYADISAYYPLLSEGGIMFGDDFRSAPGVLPAVIRFAHEQGKRLQEIDRNFWVILP